MELNQEILSDIIVHMKYARYLPELKRRETWPEICHRYETMMIEKYPLLEEEIQLWMKFVYDKKVLPSMRAMQFAGPAIARNHSRIYNCAYLPIDDIRAFSETLFLLLGGTGVGYSVQRHHVEKLPPIKKAEKTKKFLIGGDSDDLEALFDSIVMASQNEEPAAEAKPQEHSETEAPVTEASNFSGEAAVTKCFPHWAI